VVENNFFILGVPMKKIIALVFALTVVSFAMPDRVKSKSGDLAIMKVAGSSEVICSAPFQEELQLLKQEADYALVKAICAKGWVPVAAIEALAAPAKNKSFVIDDYSVFGHTDNPGSVIVLENYLDPAVMVKIDRDFRDLLVQTVDRESVERSHEEN
jgi:hypothetical protein